jgi:hypothetical protein
MYNIKPSARSTQPVHGPCAIEKLNQERNTMADFSSIAGSLLPVPPNTINPKAVGADIAPGTVVRSNGGGVGAAQANSASNCRKLGIAATAIAEGERGHVTYAGPLKLTAAEWDAVAGTTGGLTEGTPYYLSAATAGHITDTKPLSPNLVVPIGYGLSAEEIFLSDSFPITGAGG